MQRFISQIKTHKKFFIVISSVVIVLIILGVVLGVLLGSKKTDNDSGITIEKLEIAVNNEPVSVLDKSFLSEPFSFSVIINGGSIDESKDNLSVEWQIVSDDSLNCDINKNSGLFAVGDTLGSVKIQASVTGKNTVTASVIVNVTVPSDFGFYELNTVVIDGTKLNFIEGQIFEPQGVEFEAVFVDSYNDTHSVKVRNVIYDNALVLAPNISDIQISYKFNNSTRYSLIPVVVLPKTLVNIEILTPPSKLSYIEGQELNIDGLKVLAKYEYVQYEVTDFIVDKEGRTLFTSDKTFSISYTESGITKFVEQPISVAQRVLQNITVENQPNKLHYVQGQYFNPAGLIVFAHYEYMTLDITDDIEYNIDRRLNTTDTEIKYTYSENGVEISGQFNIQVESPYDKVRKIRFTNPYDATLSWMYEYMSDDGKVSIDDTDFRSYENVEYNQEKGEYVVPAGAKITLLKVSPAIIGFNINGDIVGLKYPSNTYEFELEFGEADIEIDFVKVIGNHITVRFCSESISQNFAFVYSNTHNGALSETDFAHLYQIYEETESYYYTFTCGQISYTFDELVNYSFNSDTLFVVKKHIREFGDTVKINVVYPQTTIAAILDKNSMVTLNSLPTIIRIGYKVVFSLEYDGEIINDDAFIQWLNHANVGDNIYAKYSLVMPEVESEIVGNYYFDDNENEITVEMSLNSNGTYIYKLEKNGVENCILCGVYKDNLDGTYTILSVEMGDYSLISAADFSIELSENTLYSVAFVVDINALSVSLIPIELVRQSS